MQKAVPVGLVGESSPLVKLFKSYPQMSGELYDLISSAKSEIYLATRVYERAIGSKLFAKFGDGLRINILDGDSSGIPFEERIREASRFDTKNMSEMLKLQDSPNFTVHTCKLGYSFIVVDGARCGFEVLNPVNPDEFNFAVEIDDPEMAKKFINIFNDIVRSPQRSHGPVEFETMSETELESETF